MKKRLLFIMFALMAIATGARAGVAINETNFPDAIFRQWVKDHCDDGDDILTDAEIAKVEAMRIGGLSIANLKGIEHFTALKEFVCDENRLNSLDVSQNTALILMSCSGNWLSSLDVSNNTALRYLYCNENGLRSLDVSKNTALNTLSCNENQLRSLDVSNNTALYTLSCKGNQLTSLDVSKNTMLNQLNCSSNRLTSLDVSNKTMLYKLDCSENRLTSLDLTNSSNVSEVYCSNNSIKGPAMEALIASLPEKSIGFGSIYAFAPTILYSGEWNVVTKKHVAAAEEKGWNTYYWNGSDWDDGSWELYAGSEHPVGIAINETNFPDENFRNYVKNHYDISGYEILTYDVIQGVTEIDVHWKNIADFKGIEFFTELKKLNCSNNNFSSLDLSKNTKLEYLDVSDNGLSSIDVSKYVTLKEFYCTQNQLTSLDVSKNINLEKLGCGYNQLSSLDLSKNTKLKRLVVEFNRLPSLDLSANTELNFLYCSRNWLTSLDVTNNKKLNWLHCANNSIGMTEMGKLVKSMPTVNGEPGKFYPYNSIDRDYNVITTTQVAEIKEKNWKVLKGEYPNRDFDYEGVATDIPTVSLDAPTDSPFYSLDGQRIVGKPTKKGVYVREGKKVVVK